MEVEYILSDHLGSSTLTTDIFGNKVSEIRYKPWGEIRSYTVTPPANAEDPGYYQMTRYTFTGQYSDSTINLLWYGSRHYDPALGRFIQPDSIVPLASQGVQAYDRYAYVNNDPVRYNDPTGHSVDCGIGDPFCSGGKYKPGGLISLYKQNFGKDDLERPYNSPKPIRDRLSQEIEDYLSKNPDYDEDNLIGGSPTNYGLFSSIRVDYWKNRCMESGGCDLMTEPEKLYQYYDLNDHNLSVFSPSKFDKDDLLIMGADIGSFVFGVAAISVAPEYTIFLNVPSWTLGGYSGYVSVAKKDDLIGGYLSLGGLFNPAISGASIIRDFSGGFVPYVPPIAR
jgi:RHS repeat-associated protein